MPSNATPNYQLSQWDAADRVLRADFNADNAKIDAAIKAVDTTASAKAEQSALAAEVKARTDGDSALTTKINAINALLPKKGNCRIELLTYTGSGKSGSGNPTVLRFSSVPLAFIAFGGGGILMGRGGMNAANGFVYSNLATNVTTMAPITTWSGSQISFYDNTDTYQMNCSGVSYTVLAFYKLD